jgi:hypothetical protein
MPTVQDLKDALLWTLCDVVLQLASPDGTIQIAKAVTALQIKQDEEAMSVQRAVQVNPGDIIRFNYTNYKLETEWRRAKVKHFWFGSSTYHTGEQWFCNAFCLDRNDYRNFALRDMREVSVATSAIDQFSAELKDKSNAT